LRGRSTRPDARPRQGGPRPGSWLTSAAVLVSLAPGAGMAQQAAPPANPAAPAAPAQGAPAPGTVNPGTPPVGAGTAGAGRTGGGMAGSAGTTGTGDVSATSRRLLAVPSNAGTAPAGTPGMVPAPPGGPVPTGTPVPDPVDYITLDEAIGIAQVEHGDVSAATASVEAARQRIIIARSADKPQVIGSVGYQGRGTNNLGGIFGSQPTRTVGTGAAGDPVRQVPIDTNTVTFDQGLQPRIALNFNPFNGGLTRASVRQARAALESSRSALGGVRNNLAFTVTTNYLQQLRAQQLLDLRVSQEALAEEQLRSVEARIRAEAAAEAERALVLSEYRNRQVDRISAENDARVAANALRNSMGLPVGPPLKLVELREDLDPILPVEALRDMAQRQRPEVAEAEAAVRISQQDVAIAKINRRPRLDTTIAFNVNPNNKLDRSDFAVGANVSMPLFDAGASRAREKVARYDVAGRQAQLEQVRKDVASEVQEAYLNLVNARQRLEAARLAVDAAEVNLQSTTARYRIGAPGVDVVALITAQVQYATANNSAIGALYDVHQAQAQLRRALGQY
jgi:outer membrane protein